MNMRRWRAGAALVVAAATVGGCGLFGDDGGPLGLSVAGNAADIEPSGDTVSVSRLSPLSADRLTVVVVVENGGDETIESGMVVGQVSDGAGAPVTQGSGPVLAPRRLAPGEVGFARVAFPVALPDPFTVEWTVTDGNPEPDVFGLPLSRFELAGEQIRADVKNNRDDTAVVVEVRVLCLDGSGNAIDVVTLPGPTSRVPNDGEVTVEGAALPGCAGAIGGAIGRNP